ncbi:MAG: hypothetical protein HFE52_00755 [Clostridia bacterium]|nr:hypothetical protein [Clostridia bacterium]
MTVKTLKAILQGLSEDTVIAVEDTEKIAVQSYEHSYKKRMGTEEPILVVNFIKQKTV